MKNSSHPPGQWQTVCSAIDSWLVSFIRLDDMRHIGSLAIHSFNKRGPQQWMEEPYPTTKAWHLFLMLVTSLVTHCCGMASHSSAIALTLWLSSGYQTDKVRPVGMSKGM
ncbi:hypothetical protein XENOCAPTIV_008757 [Xenoophorus captivus]|uniref:Uncharacterized protein n=2 Tax=Goodeidae TaxID=28758 RepID=A0ABV0RZD4_9TELE